MATLTKSNTPLYEGRHVTREEYLNLPDDGFRYDMIEGVLYMSPSAFSNHNLSMAKIISYFVVYFDTNFNGYVLPETDVFLPDEADVLRPDISVILKENYRILKGHIHGVPDIVCEVLSDATRIRDLGVKADRYLANGVKEYWIADPDKKTVELWFNENKSSWKKFYGSEIISRILPGFKIISTDIFVSILE